MELMRPAIVRIGNRCYRKNPIQQRDGNIAEEEAFTDFPTDSAGWNDETCTLDSPNIEKTSDGYKAVIAAPSALYKFIIGRKGETRHRLETETRTKITIPRQGQEGDIVIQGHESLGVTSAKTRIDVLLDSGRQKQPFTHFLSVPFNTPHMTDRMAEFKEDVMRTCDGDAGVDASIFQQSVKTHFTIGCLVLLNNEEVRQAVNTLQEYQQELVSPILKNEPLTVHLRGLEYMNDDPSDVDVLYAKVDDPSKRLQLLADRLVDKFTSTGLMQREFDKVKLHVTVMNTIFRKDPSGISEVRSGRDRESMDAANILHKFGDFNFGEFDISTIHISQRHSVGRDGYYTCAGALNIT